MCREQDAVRERGSTRFYEGGRRIDTGVAHSGHCFAILRQGVLNRQKRDRQKTGRSHWEDLLRSLGARAAQETRALEDLRHCRFRSSR